MGQGSSTLGSHRCPVDAQLQTSKAESVSFCQGKSGMVREPDVGSCSDLSCQGCCY